MALAGRLKGLGGLLGPVEGFLVTDITNVRYLSGFTGTSAFVLLSRSDCVFVTDFRYAGQAGSEVTGMRVVVEKKSGPPAVKAAARKMGLGRLGVEDSIPYGFYAVLDAGGFTLKAFKDPVRRLRAVKDEEEKGSIREAVRRAEAAFVMVKPRIRAGVRESDIALRLEAALRKQGARRLPFDIIVASGPNSAMPHAGASARKLSPGDLVTIDWGGEAGGYFSDMTRTFLVKGPGAARKKEIYALVLKANREGIAAVRDGASAARIDNSARDVIKKAGYGENFGHGAGHGVGLEVHELPRIAPGRRARVRKGMVFTVEPGVYVPGLGGVRIEDMVLVRDNGAEVLTSLPKGLETI